MNLIAKVSVCDYVDLVVVDFETVPAFKCGHPRIAENIYTYYDRRSQKYYKWCKRCRADTERRRWNALRRRQSGLAGTDALPATTDCTTDPAAVR